MKKEKTALEVGRETHGVKDYSWLPDFVYGGMDGAVTTFAVVAGSEGANLSLAVVLILGFANLFADGFSMSVGKYSSDKAQIEEFNRIKAMEYQHLKEKPEHEREEVAEIVAGYGFKGKELDRAVEIITSDEDVWVDLMMRNEFNMTLENINPVKGAIATFISFILIGFVPLIAYVFKPILNLESAQLFYFTCVATLLALFIVGAVKAKFTERNKLLSGLETAFIGGAAAAISFGVGYLLRGLTG